MSIYNIKSNAKINLFFAIIGIQKNNYCSIYSFMLPVNFFDHIQLSIINNNHAEDTLTQHSTLQFNDKNNTILTAINLFRQETNLKFSTEIEITKNIPIGGGLGGGSSNAGHILLTLNRHFNNILPRQTIEKIALKIGCDVPFFTYNRPALVSGVGENYSPVNAQILRKLSQKKILIFQPNYPISTSWAYTQFKKHPIFAEKSPIDILSNSNKDTILEDLIFNSFSEIILKKFPDLHNLFLTLSAIGMHVGISGSGSCCFILADKTENLSQASEIILTSYGKHSICGEFEIL